MSSTTTGRKSKHSFKSWQERMPGMTQSGTLSISRSLVRLLVKAETSWSRSSDSPALPSPVKASPLRRLRRARH
jgi:hypothetical protein